MEITTVEKYCDDCGELIVPPPDEDKSYVVFFHPRTGFAYQFHFCDKCMEYRIEILSRKREGIQRDYDTRCADLRRDHHPAPADQPALSLE